MSELRKTALDAIADLAEDLSAYFTDRAKLLDLTPLRCSLLHELSIRGPQRQKSLGELLGIGPQQAAVLVDALTDRELVDRKPDPSDRRAVIVCLTDHGKRTADDIAQARTRAADQILGHLDEGELAVLRDLLRRVDNHVRELRRIDC